MWGKRRTVNKHRLTSAVIVFCAVMPIVAAAADIVAARKDPRTFECKSLPVTALDREAVAFVDKEFLAKYFVQASNSWFARTNFYANSVITELRGPVRFAARPSPISTADELNGIAWSGQIGIYPRAYRQWRFDAKAPTESVAAEWQDMPTSYCTGVMSNWLDISAKKIEGRWLFEKGAEERFKGFHSPLPEVDVAKGAPYWSTKGATARPASASQLMGVWAGSSPHGPVRFEVKGTTKGEKSGSVAIPKCDGFLWFQGFEGETAIFAEEFPSFFSCWTGSKVRLTLQGPNAASFERKDQKGQAIAKGTVTRGEQGGGSPAAVPTTAASSAGDSRKVVAGSAASGKQATIQESVPTPALASASSASGLVGRWIASGESKGKPYRYRFDFVEGANGTLSGTFKYEPPGCKGTLVAKSAAPPNYEFAERIDDPLMLLKCGAPAALRVQVPSAGIAVLEKVDPANGRILGRVTAMLQGAAESPSAAATAVSGESAAAATKASCKDHRGAEVHEDSGSEAEHVVMLSERCGDYSVSRDGKVVYAGETLGTLDASVPGNPNVALLLATPSPLRGLQYAVLWDGDSGGGIAAHVVDPSTKRILVRNVATGMIRVGLVMRWSPEENYAVVPVIGEVQTEVVAIDLAKGRATSLNIGKHERDACDAQSIDFTQGRWVAETRYRFVVQLSQSPWAEQPCPAGRKYPAIPMTVDLATMSVARSR